MLVDIGNSRLKWAWSTPSNKEHVVHALSYKQLDITDTLYRLFKEKKPAQVTLVHVQGDDFTSTAKNIAQDNQIPIQVVESKRQLHGLTVGYTNPHQLGADRVVAMIGALQDIYTHNSSKEKIISVVDCGTAVTIDTIKTIDGLRGKGEHLGGVILPGLQLWENALITNTQRITAGGRQEDSDKLLSKRYLTVDKNDKSTFERPVELFAKNTRDGISAGCISGFGFAIQGIIQAINHQYPKHEMHVVLTGGDAPLVYQSLNHDLKLISKVEMGLVMIGLQAISESDA